MLIDSFFETIEEQIYAFDKIDLQEMDKVKLMDRVDVKYLIPIHLLANILVEARPFYKILEINGERLSNYQTLYFDTENLLLYHHHQAGKKIDIKSGFVIMLIQIFHFLK